MTEPVSAPVPAPSTGIDRAIVAISKVLSVGFALSVLVTIYDVACDLFATPTLWAYDVVTTAIAVAFLIGGSYAMQRREHIRITALFDRYPKRVQMVFEMIGTVLTVVYLAAFAWFAWKMAALAVESWEVSGSAWRQPTPVIVKVSMFIGVVLLILQAISNLRADWSALRRS